MGHIYTATHPVGKRGAIAAAALRPQTLSPIFGEFEEPEKLNPSIVLLTGGDAEALDCTLLERRFLMVALKPRIAGYLTNDLLCPAMEPLPVDRIHRELKRRLEVLREIRKAAALSPGSDEDFATWERARARGNKLSRVLINHLSDIAFSPAS